MSDQIPFQDMGSEKLEKIHEGMKVYDSEDKKIGSVERVYLGAVSPEQDELGKGPAEDYDAGAMDREDNIFDFFARGAVASDDDEDIEQIQSQLKRYGFIKIDSSGLFDADYYAMPDQIASITGDQVRLSVLKDDLIES
jgi:hypothetical protein